MLTSSLPIFSSYVLADEDYDSLIMDEDITEDDNDSLIMDEDIVTVEHNEPIAAVQDVAIPADTTIRIHTAEELAAMVGGEESEGRHYVLANNIDLTSNWWGIVDFRGVFDGQGHTIHNLQNSGLFFSTSGATVRNVTVIIEEGHRVQSIGNSLNFAGGLIHRAENTNVINAHVVGDVRARHGMGLFINGDHRAGGLIGSFVGSNGNTHRIQRSSAIGNVYSESGGGSRIAAGGLVGDVSMENGILMIEDSFSAGQVYGHSGVGSHGIGLGPAPGNVMVGGLVGSIWSSETSTSVTIANSYSASDVIITSNAFNSLGGLIGQHSNSTYFENAFRIQTQNISAPPAGTWWTHPAPTINESGILMTAEQMRNQASFVDWDFDNVWEFRGGENNGFPVLRGQSRTTPPTGQPELFPAGYYRWIVNRFGDPTTPIRHGFYEDYRSVYDAPNGTRVFLDYYVINTRGNRWYRTSYIPGFGAGTFWIYRWNLTDVEFSEVPIIVIPGIAGSQLVDTTNNNIMWLSYLDTGPFTRIRGLALNYNGNSIRGNIVANREVYGPSAGGITDVIPGVGRESLQVYINLMEDLKEEFGEERVHFWAYDWRLDNARNAEILAEFIDEEFGASTRVDIVAHSMGGLVASRYIADGNEHRIRRLITMGTPFLGSPKVPYVFATGRLVVVPVRGAISPGPMRDISSHMISAYQLLPFRSRYHYIGIGEQSGWWLWESFDSWEPVPNSFDFIRDTLQMTGVASNNIPGSRRQRFLDRATDFMDSLWIGDQHAIETVDSFVIVGDAHRTIHTTVFDQSGSYITHFTFAGEDGQIMGDETVPLWSANINGLVDTINFPYGHTSMVSETRVIQAVINIINHGSVDANARTQPRPFTVIRIASPIQAMITRYDGEFLSSIYGNENYISDFGSLYMIGPDGNSEFFAIDGDRAKDVRIEGTGQGTMDYTMGFFDSNGVLIEERAFHNVPITSNTIITTSTDRYNDTRLFVDINGNGEYDFVLHPSINSPVNGVMFSFTVVAEDGGIIVEGYSATHVAGSIIDLEAEANSGFRFSHWSSTYGGAFSNANSASTTFTMSDSPTVVTAHFLPIDPSEPTPTPDPGTPTPDMSFRHGGFRTSPTQPPVVPATPSPTPTPPPSEIEVPVAEALHRLGLFVGTGTDADGNPVFELNRPPTRLEALALVIRLMGLQNEAIAFTGDNRFTDIPGWGNHYAAFGYSIGITVGVNEERTLFAPNRQVTAHEFTTFLLRVLGYSEADGDFIFEEAMQKASTIGFFSPFDIARVSTDNFLRDHAVHAMANALLTQPKGSNEYLLYRLTNQGVFSREDADWFQQNVR